MGSYNRRDALLTKLVEAGVEVDAANTVVNEAAKLLDRAQERLSKAFDAEYKIREELESLTIVQVVYLTKPLSGNPNNTPLKSRESFDYLDGTFEGLRVGDVVVAPTRYNKNQRGIVVQVGGPRTYWGQLKKITEVLYP